MSTTIRPPFTLETALAKVRAAENAWNSRDPQRVSKVYTKDTEWRDRTEFLKGREAVCGFLARKWAKDSARTESPCDSSTSGGTTGAIARVAVLADA